VNGSKYGRVADSDISGAVLRSFDLNRWTPPGAKQCLSHSDRDMFLFLVDSENEIAVSNRRNGEAGTLKRGVMIWNSCVAHLTLGIATFLFDDLCLNRTIFGLSDFGELRIRHTSGAPHRWLEEMLPAIKAYGDGASAPLNQVIANAQQARIDEIDKFLLARFSKSQAAGIIASHELDEGRPMETLFDASVGITAYARTLNHNDTRSIVERAAGAVLQLAA